MIDGAVTMVLVGTAIQAAPPARAFIQLLRRRARTREAHGSLSYSSPHAGDLGRNARL